ncbi:hypothetical protein FB45DRAFT_1050378 [Roridomyces roridus]|uniref:Uncharacterized protein n=1 Tax=Roridomyces roridus TaxID=1738132 RepID=A0AAD7CLP7_9AGAR|nr:hypothetical protein FB45DRAFT_1050378 [Roridomyces roridus]
MSEFEAQSAAPPLRSMSSTSSLGSVSLARRSRTRTRSKTQSSPRPDATAFPELSGAVPLVGEPLEMSQEEQERAGEELEPKNSKAAEQARKLPGISTAPFNPPPSAFSRVPSIPQLYDLGGGNNIRDSVASGLTSSVYPASTSASTASGTDSPPSPRSMAPQDEHGDVSSFDPELEYEGDDVAYRLRLLVNNQYFLPPSHAKPTDFATQKQSRPPPTPTFFDIFRKSRSKPSTPTASSPTFDPFTPALRTTSDSTTASAYPRRRSSSQAPPQSRTPQDPSGRVVVVREQMRDIATAAKQAEQEMKSRGNLPEQSFGHSEVDIIDPTDAVDLPPPSATYPFAVQAAALNGMGVEESVGAAVLADRLPPRSPGGLSVDHDWRKALLHAAVNHSLSNSNASGVLASPIQISPVSEKSMLGQRIVSPPLVEAEAPPSSPPSTREDPDESDNAPRSSSCLPSRVETPSMPLTPLAPPPRRQIFNPLYSISQTSLPTAGLGPTPRSSQMEPGRLSDSYEAGVRQALISPPPQRESSESSGGGQGRASSDSGTSYYSEDEGRRPSVSSSVAESRPSLSIHSQPSPTTSAFQDALSQPPVINPPPRESSLRHSLDHRPFIASPRESTVSPPPRVSSSLAHVTPLSPPPRKSSLGRLPGRLPPPSPISPPTLAEAAEILEPEPVSPPLPRRRNEHLLVEIPSTSHPSIRSAPAPTTPPSFFDTIQSQPNAMDDLDSSSDEDSYQGDPEPPHTPIYMDPHTRALSNMASTPSSSSRSLLMRLGNHSTPYVTRSADGHSHRPVGNVPAAPASFFTERRGGSRKSEQGHGPPTSTFDFYRYAQQHPLISPPADATAHRRPHTSDQASGSSQKAQESMRRLDGLLIQHMEAEKDTIKRITTTIQSNART